MKICIINHWHDDNKGDSSITIGTITRLQRVFGDEVTFAVVPCIAKNNPIWAGALRHTLQHFPKIKVLAPSLPAFPIKKGPLWLVAILRSILKLVFPCSIQSKSDESFVEESDLIILRGGLYLAFSRTSILRPPLGLFAYGYLFLYGARLGKPVVLYGHSLGPFNNWASNLFMKWLLCKASVVIVRESASKSLVETLGVPAPKLLVFPDSAFDMPVAHISSINSLLLQHGLEEGKFAVVSARNLLNYGHTGEIYRYYLEQMSEVIEYLVKIHNLKVAIVSHTQGPTPDEDDRFTSQKLYSLLGEITKEQTTVVNEDLSPPDLAAFYSRALLTVATRFHAAVLSLRVGTPTIAISYFGTKAQGTFTDLGLSEYVVSANEVTGAKIRELIDRLLKDPEERKRFTAAKEQALQRLSFITDVFQNMSRSPNSSVKMPPSAD